MMQSARLDSLAPSRKAWP